MLLVIHEHYQIGQYRSDKKCDLALFPTSKTKILTLSSEPLYVMYVKKNYSTTITSIQVHEHSTALLLNNN